jgi:predicted RNase H-like HicB family nuclease
MPKTKPASKKTVSIRHPFEVVLHPAEEGGYWVTVKGVPGCYSEGDTKREALRNIREALTVHMEALAILAARDGRKATKAKAHG